MISIEERKPAMRIVGMIAAAVVLLSLLAVQPADAGDIDFRRNHGTIGKIMYAGPYRCRIHNFMPGSFPGKPVVAIGQVDCQDANGNRPYRVWTRFVLKRHGTSRAMAFEYANTTNKPWISGLASKAKCKRGSRWQGVLTFRVYDRYGNIYNPTKGQQLVTTGAPFKICW